MPRPGWRRQQLRAEPDGIAEAPVARAIRRDGDQRPAEHQQLAAERHAVLRPCRGRGHLSRRHLWLPEGAVRRRARPRPAGTHRPMRRLALLALLLATPAAAQTGDLVATDALRVCADPANLPFSNDRGEGFENRIAALLGQALDRKVDYVFFPQVQGFVRNTLRAGRCDLVIGTVAGDELMQNTNPYSHTSYVVAFRSDHRVRERLDDRAMKTLRLGAIARTPPIDLLL